MKNPLVRGFEVALAAAGAFAIFHFLPKEEAPYALSLWTALWSQYGVSLAKGAGQ